jgi:hypothetical protein
MNRTMTDAVSYADIIVFSMCISLFCYLEVSFITDFTCTAFHFEILKKMLILSAQFRILQIRLWASIYGHVKK